MRKLNKTSKILSRVSNPSETSALSYRVRTAKPGVARSMANYDRIYINSIPNENDDEATKKCLIAELTEFPKGDLATKNINVTSSTSYPV